MKDNQGQGASEEDLTGLIHKAAAYGSRRQAKKAILGGIKVDVQNEDGQTPLFLACLEGHQSVVDLLLRHDANPNLRSLNGSTTVHAAAFAGHVKILEKLIEAGGDLRFHDNEGRSPRDWALLQDDPKKKRRMIDFIEKSRLFAMSSKGSPEFLHPQRDTSLVGSIRNLSLRKLNPSAVLEMFRQKGSHELHNVKSAGFGKIYVEGKDHKIGTVAAVPLIDEYDVTHNNQGVTYNNGPFMVMESMLWGKTPVTAKRLHRNRPQGGVVDLLIEEHDHIVNLRHSSILLLMAICQTENLDGMVLIYEPVAVGSLYHYLHERFESVSPSDVRNILRQIASALLFLHRQNIIHCWVTSHAVQLVTPSTAKLGNLEYAIEQDSREEKTSLVSQNTYANAAYNWMAPEVMDGTAPSFASDLYSFCVVIWEMLMAEVPWSGKTADVIVIDMLEEGCQLPVEEANIPMPYNVVLEWGLSLKPEKRKISMEQLVEILETFSMNPEKKSWKVNSKSSVHSHAPDVRCEKSSSRHDRPLRRKSSEYLAWYRTHHGGHAGHLDETTGLYHKRSGALDELPCSHMKRSLQHLNRQCSCYQGIGIKHIDGDISAEDYKRSSPTRERPYHEKDDSPNSMKSAHLDKASSPHSECKISSHSHSCLYGEGHYKTSGSTLDHSKMKKSLSRHTRRSSPSDEMSTSPCERPSSPHQKTKRSGSFSKKPSPMNQDKRPSSYDMKIVSEFDKYHLDDRMSQSSEESSQIYNSKEKRSEFNREPYSHRYHSKEKKVEPSHYQKPGPHQHDLLNSRFNSSTGMCHGSLTLQGKSEHMPYHATEWKSNHRDKVIETESETSTTSTTHTGDTYIQNPFNKRQFLREAPALIKEGSAANVQQVGEVQSSDYRESASEERLVQAPLPSCLSLEETRRSSVPVNLPSTKREEHKNETNRRRHSTVYGALSIYGTSGLVQQKPAIIPSAVLENSDGSVKELNHSGETKSSFEGKKRSSYGSLAGFKPATHITEHVLDYKIWPVIGAFEVAKGRISKENFDSIKDTVAKMDRVVREINESAVKRCKARLSVSQSPDMPDRTSKINTIRQVSRHSILSLVSQESRPEDEWYAGKGSVRNLVDDYEEMEEQAEKEAGSIGKYKYPVCGILAPKSSHRTSSGEVVSDQRWSDEEDRQLSYQKKTSHGAQEEKRKAGIDIATQTAKMYNPVRDDHQMQQLPHFPQTGSDSQLVLERKLQRQGTKSQMMKYTRNFEDIRQYQVVGPGIVSTGSNTDTDRSSFHDEPLRVSRMGMKNTKDGDIENFIESLTESAVEDTQSSMEIFYSATSVCIESNPSAEDLQGESIECHHGSFDTDNQTRPTPAAGQANTKNAKKKMEVTFSNAVLEKAYSDITASSAENSSDYASPESLASENIYITASSAENSADCASPESLASENIARILEIEDFYNDDVISPGMNNVDHMRLQTTMSLDTSSLSKGVPIPFDDSSIVEQSQGDCDTVMKTPLPTPMPSERKKQLLACSTPNRMIPRMVEISEIQDPSCNGEQLSNGSVDASASAESLAAAEETDGPSLNMDSDVDEQSLAVDGDGDNTPVKDEKVERIGGGQANFV